MYTWILILVANMLVIATVGIILMRRSRYRSMKPLLFILVAALSFGGIWLAAQNHLENKIIGTAEALITWEQCPENSDKTIYFNSEEGSYFFVTYDNWEFAPLFKRTYLDPVRTAEFVELSTLIEDYKINNMIISK